MEHYYSKNPQSKFTTETWEYIYNGHPLTFTSGSGIFSKGKIDFGSQLLIQSFQEPEIDGEILDVGCGYGIIGITLARAYTKRHITMIDINERAIELSNRNIQQNEISNASSFQSDGLSSLPTETKFAAIVMNPPIRVGKAKVYDLFKQCQSALKPSGEFWIVIQKKQGAPSAEKFLSTLFEEVQIVNRKKGYVILKSK